MRDKFPIFKKHPKLIYLDSAATAHKPQCVIDAINQFYAEEYGTVHRAIYKSAILSTEHYNEARKAAAKFINADNIVFTRGTTDALNIIARSLVKPGDEVLISEMEHHSNIVPWQLVGATLKIIPMDERGVLQWRGMITEKTKIISLAQCSNVTGTINPIAEIAKHKQNALLVVDGAQAAPHMKIDVKALGCDFYAFSGHKCYGPTGIGVLYGKNMENMQPVQGGGDMIEEVTFEKTTFQKPPLRFEAGTPPIASAIALKAALEFIEEHREQEDLLSYATQKLEGLVQIIGTAPEKGPIITFHVPGVHPLDIATLLDLKNIAIRSGHLCAQPCLRKFGLEAAARISFGLYNTKEDVDYCAAALRTALSQLR